MPQISGTMLLATPPGYTIAEQFEAVIGIASKFWINLENTYRYKKKLIEEGREDEYFK